MLERSQQWHTDRANTCGGKAEGNISIVLTRSIRDSEISIDFVQGPPGSRRERVNVRERDPRKRYNLNIFAWIITKPVAFIFIVLFSIL